MIVWTLATRDGFFGVHENSIEDGILAGRPLIIDPSITFRKHFEIPTDVDRNPEKLKLELFSRFLPSEIDDYVCQFREGPIAEEGTRRVLGLAIKDDDMRWLEGQPGEETDKYFLENLLRPAPDSSGTRCVQLSLPNGVYFGVFDGDFLTWSRYLNTPRDETIEKTRSFVQGEFQDVNRILSLPTFPGTEGDAASWVNALTDWLPDAPSPDRKLTRSQSSRHWKDWRKTAWTLLILGLLAVGLWTVYYYQSIQRKHQWLANKSQVLLDKHKRPTETLNSRIKSLRQKIRSQSNEVADVYPRLFQLDQTLKQHAIYLLQMNVRNSQGQLVLMTNSLQSAEDLKEALLAHSDIERVEIVSTTPRENGNYQFKVNINVQWTPTT